MKFFVKWDPGSMNRLHMKFVGVKMATHRTGWNALNRLAVFTAFSAEKAANIGKARRPLFTARNRAEQRAIGGNRYGVQFLGVKSSGAVDGGWRYTNDKAKAEGWRVVRYRGLARASWSSIKAKLGAKPSAFSAHVWRVARGVTWVSFKRSRPMQITFRNRLKYMGLIQPTILREALAKARQRFAYVEAMRIEKAQQNAWRYAA
jgi:hypothetical protein